ncbi:MAG: mannose-1-phosphate guanylyltransferase [Chlamydiales bacterium]|jgi:mannose-1-phosphate guanylyltransferase
MSTPDVYAVIMAGGTGTRFWPASRRAKPKQFLTIASDRPLIDETFRRLDGLVPPERILVVTGAAHADEVRAALPQLPEANLLVEPSAHNTLPCAALAAFEIRRRCERSIQILLPADHIIRPTDRFQASLRAGIETAARDASFVTFGVQPTHASTGYGYIETGAPQAEAQGESVLAVEAFHEKPDAHRAEAYLESGRHLWNSGIFIWDSTTFLAELQRQAAHIHDGLADVDPRACDAAYDALPSVSLDVGLMEGAGSVRVLPIDYTWDDVGSWSALFDVLSGDSDGHRVVGGAQVASVDSQDCVVFGPPGSITALIGVSDLVVVQTERATLVCPRDRAQDVRRAVEQIRALDPTLL